MYIHFLVCLLIVKRRDMKEVYFRKDIEEYLINNKRFSTKIYNTFDELKISEKELNICSKNIFEFTDGLFNYNNSNCYIISGNVFSNDQYGINMIFINYDKNDVPTAIFVEDNFCEITKTIASMVKISQDYLKSSSTKN